jgi:hypothetical protein
MLYCVERRVCFLQRERDDTRSKIQITRQGEKIARILPGHVGHTADLSLAPEQLVVVEGGQLIEVNGVDCDYSTFAQGGESTNDNLPAGSERDGAIKLGGRLCVFVADRSVLMGEMKRATARERQAWAEQMQEQARMKSTLVIAAAIIAAIRLARDPDISPPSPRLTSVVSDSVNLARMILDRVSR